MVGGSAGAIGPPVGSAGPLGDTGDDRWRMVPVAKRPTVKDTRKNQWAGGAREPWEATRLGEGKPRSQTRGRTPR